MLAFIIEAASIGLATFKGDLECASFCRNDDKNKNWICLLNFWLKRLLIASLKQLNIKDLNKYPKIYTKHLLKMFIKLWVNLVL